MKADSIYGIVPPMVTPFNSLGEVDESGFRSDVHHLIEEAGVHGLAVTGSTGEGHALSDGEVARISAWAVEESQGRVPIITGIKTNSTEAAIRRGRLVRDLGVTALQVTPVHYLFRPEDDAMLRHFEAVSEGIGLPIIIYNVVPWSYLSPALLARIFDAVDGVVGVKQSASDLKTLADLLLIRANNPNLAGRRLLTAVDPLLYPSFQLGADGAVGALLTAAPKWSVDLWDAVKAGDQEGALKLHTLLLGLWNAIDGPNLPANVKTAMRLQGRKGGEPRPPMPATDPGQEKRILEALQLSGQG